MMKVSILKKSITLILAGTIAFSSICYCAPSVEKTETVYVNLDYYGKVQQINVLNNCIINGQSEIKDYGEFEKISNLTNRLSPLQSDGMTTWNVDGLKYFTYTGKVSNDRIIDVPWTFDVSYKLNGVTSTPEEIIGKSGLVKVTLDINANKEAKDFYKNNYLLEVTGSYDLNDYLSVDSPDAMFITSGKTKTLMFIVLPGQSTQLSLELGTENFEMDGITCAMVPLEGEILEKIEELVDTKKDFEDAMDTLNSSADVVLNVMGNMTGDLQEVSSGMSQMQSGTTDIHNLSQMRDEDIAKLKESLITTKGLIDNCEEDANNIKADIENVYCLMEEINPLMTEVLRDSKNIQGNLDDIEDIIEDLPSDIGDLKDAINTSQKLIGNTISLLDSQGSAGDIDTDALSANLQSIASSAYTILGVTPSEFAEMSNEEKYTLMQESTEKAKAIEILGKLVEIQSTLGEIEDAMGDAQSSSNSLTSNLEKMRTHLKNLEKKLDTDDGKVVQESVSNINELVQELNSMLDILIKYNDKFISSKDNLPNTIDNLKLMLEEAGKMDEIATNTITRLQTVLNIVDTKIYVGANQMTSGLIGTVDKMGRITAQSNNILNAKNKAKNVIQNKWDDIDSKTTIFNVDSKAKVISFTSDKNESPEKVQFMLKTPDIKKVKEDLEDLESKKNNGTFWDRIVAVFKKLFGWIFE